MTPIELADAAVIRIDAFLRGAPELDLVDQITGCYAEIAHAGKVLEAIADQLKTEN